MGSKASNVGLFVILGKLGPKLAVVLFKMKGIFLSAFKGLGGVKSAGVVLSAAMYTYLFTWQMAVGLMLFIGIHEYGHLWAMHRCGVRTRGMFFVPGFGAVAIAEDRFGSARNEAYIALMGPVFGIVGFVLPMLLAYRATHHPMWAAIASIMTLINLINLFPINPLDGGRVMKALVYSRWVGRSFVIAVGISLLTAGLAIAAGYELLWYLAFVGFYELAKDFGVFDRLNKLFRTLVRIALVATIVWLTWTLVKYWGNWGLWQWVGAGALWFAIGGLGTEIWLASVKIGFPLWLYPRIVVQDVGIGAKQLLSLRLRHVQPIADYDWMEGKQKVFYALCFVGLVVFHVSLLVLLAHIPEASFANDLLKD